MQNVATVLFALAFVGLLATVALGVVSLVVATAWRRLAAGSHTTSAEG